MTSHDRPRRGARPAGQALVEFALVVPIFLILLFGLIEVGRYIYLNNAFNEAAREAARFGSVEQWEHSCPGSVSSPDRFTCTAQIAKERVAGAPAGVEVVVTCHSMDSAEPEGPGLSPDVCGSNDLLVVTVRTPSSGPTAFRFLTPVIGQLLGTPVITGQTQVVIQ
jgi:hypothetical protein